MKKLIALCLVILCACQPSAKALQGPVSETLTAWPTSSPYPTYTPAATQTPWIVIVTPTFTASPVFTPTVTFTPTITPTRTKTPDLTKTDKGPGFYLVGSEIAPGLWKSQATGDDCYWELDTRTGDIISNHFGFAGITMYIPSTAFSATMQDECGRWTYLGE